MSPGAPAAASRAGGSAGPRPSGSTPAPWRRGSSCAPSRSCSSSAPTPTSSAPGHRARAAPARGVQPGSVRPRRGRPRHPRARLLTALRRVAAPAVVVAAAAHVVTGQYALSTLALLNWVFGEERLEPDWRFWFIESAVAVLLLVTAVVATPWGDRLERRHPFASRSPSPGSGCCGGRRCCSRRCRTCRAARPSSRGCSSSAGPPRAPTGCASGSSSRWWRSLGGHVLRQPSARPPHADRRPARALGADAARPPRPRAGRARPRLEPPCSSTSCTGRCSRPCGRRRGCRSPPGWLPASSTGSRGPAAPPGSGGSSRRCSPVASARGHRSTRMPPASPPRSWRVGGAAGHRRGGAGILLTDPQHPGPDARCRMLERD